MFQQANLFCAVSIIAQWSLLFWLNLRLELDPFVQLIVVPILMLLGLALLVAHPTTDCD